MSEKQYWVNVELKWSNLVNAENMEDAIKTIKRTMEHEHNLDLDDDEIISIELVNHKGVNDDIKRD